MPIRIRPRTGETVDAYVVRLALANHLKPSYLRRYLAQPRGSAGSVDPERLAVLSGRTVDALIRAFPAAQQRARRAGNGQTEADRRQEATDRKSELYLALRVDYEAGLSGRQLQRKHHVGSRTVQYALSDPQPRASKKKPNRASPHKHLRPHIDAILAANPQASTVTIWEQLLDDLHATISYTAVRAYLRNRDGNPLMREEPTSPGETEKTVEEPSLDTKSVKNYR